MSRIIGQADFAGGGNFSVTSKHIRRFAAVSDARESGGPKKMTRPVEGFPAPQTERATSYSASVQN